MDGKSFKKAKRLGESTGSDKIQTNTMLSFIRPGQTAVPPSNQPSEIPGSNFVFL